MLRSLAINDTHFGEDGTDVEFHALDAKTLALVRVGALIAVGGAVPSYGAETDAAVNAGATASEIVEVLLGVVPIVGLPASSPPPRTSRWRSATTPTKPWNTNPEPDRVRHTVWVT